MSHVGYVRFVRQGRVTYFVSDGDIKFEMITSRVLPELLSVNLCNTNLSYLTRLHDPKLIRQAGANTTFLVCEFSVDFAQLLMSRFLQIRVSELSNRVGYNLPTGT